MAEAEALMAEIGSGDYKARAAKKAAEAQMQSEAGLATQGLKLRCDVNGCVIVPINANQHTPGLAGNVHCQPFHGAALNAMREGFSDSCTDLWVIS